MTRRIMESFYARNRWAPGGGVIPVARRANSEPIPLLARPDSTVREKIFLLGHLGQLLLRANNLRRPFRPREFRQPG